MKSTAELPAARFPTIARIVATIGPASDSPETVARLISLGVRVFRFNFSHGSFDEHGARLKTVRRVADEMDMPIAVLGDLPGPKIRVGKVEGSGVMLEAGQDVVFSRGVDVAEEREEHGRRVVVFPTTYPQLIDEVQAGQRVLLNDGAVRMLSVESGDDGTRGELRCRVTVGGLITTGKGINLPETDVTAPAVGERDWEICQWAVAHGLDFLAMSFVRRAEEVLELRARLESICAADRAIAEMHGSRIPLVAKIEKPQAVAEIDAIADAADAVMVARGDLGVEMDIAQTPVSQKRIIEACHHHGTPVIVATQMLESMIDSASPTRAEASDVANAVFDGADCVMLSGETAVGKHPDLVVETMSRIIRAAEERIRELPRRATPPPSFSAQKYRTAALAHGAWHIAMDFDAELVICWSQQAGTARFLSQNGFRIPIVAYSSDARFTRRMAVLGGVSPFLRDAPVSIDAWVKMVDEDLVSKGWATNGTRIVLVAGEPLGVAKTTSSVITHLVHGPGQGGV
ncbi:MAG: pyruvate kinase [Planctomycetota bacterium]